MCVCIETYAVILFNKLIKYKYLLIVKHYVYSREKILYILYVNKYLCFAPFHILKRRLFSTIQPLTHSSHVYITVPYERNTVL